LPSDEGPSPALYSLHLWAAGTGEGRLEWRGKVHHLASGDARYFRDWSGLVTFLETTLAATSEAPASGPDWPGSDPPLIS
jgi:hypothetical protein